MARRTIDSTATGEIFVFDDDWNEPDGRVRQIEYRLAPGRAVPQHSHPATAQSFAVVAGTLYVSVDGKTRAVGPGERVETGPGGVHAQWNEGPATVRVIEGYDPPIAIEPFFTVLPHAVASANPLKIAVFFSDFRAVSAPSTWRQRAFIAVFAPLGRLLGQARWYTPLIPRRSAIT